MLWREESGSGTLRPAPQGEKIAFAEMHLLHLCTATQSADPARFRWNALMRAARTIATHRLITRFQKTFQNERIDPRKTRLPFQYRVTASAAIL